MTSKNLPTLPARGRRPGRRERTKARTRRRLIAGARELIGREGVEGVTIAGVSARADVGFGTFYGYFASKGELTREVVADTLEQLGATNDALTAGLSDPARVISVAVRNTLSLVDRQPEWARFMVRVAFSNDRALWSGLHARVVRDLRRGKDARRFSIDDPKAVSYLVAGSVLSAMRARLEGRLARRSDAEVVTRILGMLGVSADEAARIARLPQPQLGPREAHDDTSAVGFH